MSGRQSEVIVFGPRPRSRPWSQVRISGSQHVSSGGLCGLPALHASAVLLYLSPLPANLVFNRLERLTFYKSLNTASAEFSIGCTDMICNSSTRVQPLHNIPNQLSRSHRLTAAKPERNFAKSTPSSEAADFHALSGIKQDQKSKNGSY